MRKDIDVTALQIFEAAAQGSSDSVVLRLLTRSEKIAIGRRIFIAQGILAGKTRFEINEEIKVSPNTFAQINRWLESELDDYASAYKKPTNNQKSKSKYVKSFSYDHLKRNFPMHFILFSQVENILKKK